MFDFCLYTQVSDSGPHGPLDFLFFFFFFFFFFFLFGGWMGDGGGTIKEKNEVHLVFKD